MTIDEELAIQIGDAVGVQYEKAEGIEILAVLYLTKESEEGVQVMKGDETLIHMNGREKEVIHHLHTTSGHVCLHHLVLVPITARNVPLLVMADPLPAALLTPLRTVPPDLQLCPQMQLP